MKIIRMFLLLLCFGTVLKIYTVQDTSPHVVIQISKEKANPDTCDHHSCNARILLYNLVGLALGTTAYVVSSSMTHNLASQVLATISLGTLPPLFGAASEIYSYYRNK